MEQEQQNLSSTVKDLGYLSMSELRDEAKKLGIRFSKYTYPTRHRRALINDIMKAKSAKHGSRPVKDIESSDVQETFKTTDKVLGLRQEVFGLKQEVLGLRQEMFNLKNLIFLLQRDIMVFRNTQVAEVQKLKELKTHPKTNVIENKWANGPPKISR